MNKKRIKNAIHWIVNEFKSTTVLKVDIKYLSPNQRLSGKKVIITGGSRGLGYAMAKKFLSEGAEVLITGRKKETLETSAKELGCKHLVFDSSEVSQIDEFLTSADTLLGGANVLVNNAGISLHEGNILNVKEYQYDSQMNINLKGCYFLSQKFLSLYSNEERKNGSILFVSSERGEYADDLPYGLIKSAINSLTKGLSKLYIKKNIRINAIAPGVTATSMTGREEDNLYASNYSTGRVYLPDEVAEIACFLLSDAASCLSGQILVCNNGSSINFYK